MNIRTETKNYQKKINQKTPLLLRKINKINRVWTRPIKPKNKQVSNKSTKYRTKDPADIERFANIKKYIFKNGILVRK